MGTSLHRSLKDVYANNGSQVEAPLGRYRIDVVSDGELIEIQHGSLSVIRDKVRNLLRDHRVLVVKPIVVRKRLVKQDARGGVLFAGTFCTFVREFSPLSPAKPAIRPSPQRTHVVSALSKVAE